jgi:HK97 family phage portal protein
VQLPQVVRRSADAILGPSGEIVSRAAVSTMGVDGWWQWAPLQEPYTGAFQQGFQTERNEQVLAFSAVFACVSLRANDIAKLRIKLVEYDKKTRIWEEVDVPAYSPVLRKPNRYQTRIQFLKQWVTSKLLWGNTYVLKERDNRGVVIRLYVLDPRLVKPLVTASGDVYYQIGCDNLSGISEPDETIVPASEIIHDRGLTPYHPLCGISPIFACATSSSQGSRIQSQAMRFFANAGRPSGMLTAPGKIDDGTAKRLKQETESAISGANIGRLLVAGNGLTYEAFEMMSPVDSQLVEQLNWTAFDVARAFMVPPSKLGLATGASGKADEQSDMAYYKQTLQCDIEEIEILLDEGIGLGPTSGNAYGTELDLEGLLRMDPKARAEAREIDIRSGVLAPNEGRRQEDFAPVEGGESPMIQQQNYSLSALAKRDAKEDPFASASRTAEPMPAEPAPRAAVVQRSIDIDEFAAELASEVA